MSRLQTLLSNSTCAATAWGLASTARRAASRREPPELQGRRVIRRRQGLPCRRTPCPPRSRRRRQGLTLVHFSAQSEPFLTQEHTLSTPCPPLAPREHSVNTPLTHPLFHTKALTLSRKVDECKPLGVGRAERRHGGSAPRGAGLAADHAARRGPRQRGGCRGGGQHPGQGLALVHFSAQRKRFLCVWGLFRMCGLF